MKCQNCGAEVQGKFCEYCGRELPQAQENVTVHITKNYYVNVSQETFEDKAKTKNKKSIWLWVLGWIFLFPVPVTILVRRNKKMSSKKKKAIIIGVWLLYLLIGLSGESEETIDSNAMSVQVEYQQEEC